MVAAAVAVDTMALHCSAAAVAGAVVEAAGTLVLVVAEAVAVAVVAAGM